MNPTMGQMVREHFAKVPAGHTTDRDGSVVPGSVYDDDHRDVDIPNYTEHLRARQEAANKARERFVNRVGPTIHVQLQVRHVVAQSYAHARTQAFHHCCEAWGLEDILYGTLGINESEWEAQWNTLARVAKEVDGTYTVTLP